jgi:hypothetical protein
MVVKLREALLLLVGATALAVLPAPAEASSAAPPHAPPAICVPVRATGTGQDQGGGHTVATISRGRLVLGTTTGDFTVTGIESGVVSFTGPIIFTSSLGTLTAPVTGTLDATTGAFTSSSTALTGTGAFSGVTGTVQIAGTEDLTTGAFTEVLRARLCLAPGR